MSNSFQMSDQFLEDEVQPAYADAPVEHIRQEKLFGVQRKIFFITTPEGATLEQLAASAKNGIEWTLPQEMKTLLKQVNKTTNRSVASEKDLEGDLGKALFLSAKVISNWSDAPKMLDFNIPGLVPTGHTATGRASWVIPPNCPFTVVNQCIFEPDSIFTEFMYKHQQKCDSKTLDKHIRMNIDPNKQFCEMESKGVGWKVLTDNIDRYAEDFEAIYAKNQHIFDNPESPYNQIAQVPYHIGKEVYEDIAGPIRDIEKSLIDFNTWKVKITPSNKRGWSDTNGLIRDAIAFGADTIGSEVEARLNTPFSAGIALELAYVLNN